LWDQLAFDDALAVALRFAAGRDDTLVVVTTDHGNSNPGLNGWGSSYSDSNAHFERLARATVSYERLYPRLVATKHSADDTRALLRAATGLEVTADEAQVVADAIAGEKIHALNRQHANWVGALGQVLGNHNGVGWTGVTHTADYVVLTAVGPGSEHFRGLRKNTDAYDGITRMWGIDHRNPTMTREAAAAFPAPTLAEAECVDAYMTCV
jgi:alkaline phosphatase